MMIGTRIIGLKVLFLCGLLGCETKGVAFDDTAGGGAGSNSDSAGGGGGGGGGGSGTDDGVSPTISTADAWCYADETGGKDYFWSATATADDPQGIDTLETLLDEGVYVLNSSGTQVAAYPMVCSEDAGCITSWKQSEDGVSCSSASNYTIQFVVQDQDGNTSDPYEVAGRQGTDASG
jgi:hypothetical protein